MTSRHQFIWNTASFSDATDANVYCLFEEALRGLVQIPAAGETAELYCDDATPLLKRQISPSRSVGDFVAHLEATGEQDLAMILAEIDDKANAVYSLPFERLDHLAKSSYYFNSLPYSTSIDYLALAADLDGVLFSVASAKHWESHEVEVGRVLDEKAAGEPGFILSVCNIATAKRILDLVSPASETVSLDDLVPGCVISKELLEWFDRLDLENQRISRRKLSLAHGRKFQGGEPLFKTLNGGEGMREVRYKAFPGGAARILFGALENGKIALLRGFIKKSDNEGYTENVPAAAKTWSSLKAVNKKTKDRQ